ncbi:4740_t:CDS:2, partial [Dentiscutata heterogama]
PPLYEELLPFSVLWPPFYEELLSLEKKIEFVKAKELDQKRRPSMMTSNWSRKCCSHLTFGHFQFHIETEVPIARCSKSSLC